MRDDSSSCPEILDDDDDDEMFATPEDKLTLGTNEVKKRNEDDKNQN